MADDSVLPATGERIRLIEKGASKTQVVTLDLGGSGAESLLAGSVPVTGTVALDAASLSALETISVANFPATQAVTGTVTLDSTSLAALETISVANFPATQTITGTVALDSASLAALETINVGNFPATQAVTGTVALDSASLAALETISVANFPATQAVSIASLPSLAAGTNAIGRTTDTVQTGRTLFAINYNATNAAAADTLLTSLVVNRAGTATTGQTSVAVTASKTLRITGVFVSLRTTTAALPWGVLTLRMNPSGAAVIGSGAVAQFGVSGSAAVIGNTGSLSFDLGDEGMEFSGTQQIGLSFANNVNTNVTTVTLVGYEYTTPS